MNVERISNVIEPTITSLGFVLWGCDLNQHGYAMTLRVYIDGQDQRGATLEDCARVSREISALLDVENVIDRRYHLEVSSPGIERRLFTLAQFKNYIGEMVKITLHVAKNGRRQFEARIQKMEGDTIFLDVSCADTIRAASVSERPEIISISFHEIQKAKLISAIPAEDLNGV